jgi:hypothetical protein
LYFDATFSQLFSYHQWCLADSLDMVGCLSEKYMNFSLAQTIATLTLGLLAIAVQAQEPDFSVNQSPGCVFTEQQLALVQAVNIGYAKPVDAARSAGRLALTIPEMNQWTIASHRLDSLWVPDVRYAIDGKPWPVFVAVFDGTWNDKEDLGLPRTVPAQLADDLAALARTDPLVLPHYYEGVGTREFGLLKLWDGATGRGTVERAERALLDLKAATSANGGVVPYVYAIGFSRGAASARHFLNLADSLTSTDMRIKSSALLFDTVATGQTNRLALGLPASNDLTVQLVATREYRFAFPYIPVQTDAGHHPSLANGNADQVVEVRVPGAHSDIGGGYDEGLWKLSLAMSRALLKRQGFAIPSDTLVSNAQAILNMGRHDSDWFKVWVNGTERPRSVAMSSVTMSSVANKTEVHDEADIFKAIDRSARIAQAVKRSSSINTPSLFFKIDRRGDVYRMSHNCQSHTFAIDARAHAITLDGKPFQQLSESQWQFIDAGYGILLRTEPEDPANWILTVQ